MASSSSSFESESSWLRLAQQEPADRNRWQRWTGTVRNRQYNAGSVSRLVVCRHRSLSWPSQYRAEPHVFLSADVEARIGGSVNLRTKTDKRAHIGEGIVEPDTAVGDWYPDYPDRTSNSYIRPNSDLRAPSPDNIAIGNILTERLQWARILTVADAAAGLHDVKWVLRLQICTG